MIENNRKNVGEMEKKDSDKEKREKERQKRMVNK